MNNAQLTTAREILTNSTIDGHTLRLPDRQLPRPAYLAVKNALESMGGTWNRRTRVHDFPADPSAAVAAFINGGALAPPARTAEGYVATPADLAAAIIADHTEISDLDAGATILEPSAGDGAFVRAIHQANPEASITAVEPNQQRLNLIDPTSASLVHSTFEDFSATATTRYSAIVMNPPFAVPGAPTLWIDHVQLAFELLAPGGRVTAIAPVGLLERGDRKHTAIRELVETHGGAIRLPAQAFKTSGTEVRTAVLWLDAAQ